MEKSEDQSTKRRIRLLFLGSYETDRRIKSFSRYFSRSGFTTEVIFAQPGFAESRSWIDREIRITQLPLDLSSGPLMFLRFKHILTKHTSNLQRADITFAADLYSLSTARTLKYKGLTSKIIYDARELYTELPSLKAKPITKLYWRFVEKRGLDISDRVLVTAPYDANAILAVHGFLPKSLLIRNLPEPFDLSHRSNYLREKYQIGGKKILVYAGGIQKDRGLIEMISAMHRLQSEFVFVLIGNGPLTDELTQKVKSEGLEKSVMFHPAVHSDTLQSVLTSADIGVCMILTHSGSYELALPSKIFEYFQAGLPVLSSKMKQVMELFPNEEMITFTDPTEHGIIQGLNDISSVVSDPILSQKLSQQINNSFSFDTDAHVLQSFLRF